MDKLKEAKAYLDDVCKSLINKNRFIVDKTFQTYLEKILHENRQEIAVNSKFFRARNYTDQEVDPSKLGTQYEGRIGLIANNDAKLYEIQRIIASSKTSIFEL